MIIDVDPPSQNPVIDAKASQRTHDKRSQNSDSPSEISKPVTPLDSDGSNNDLRYVYIPEEGIEIPLTYDEPQTPKGKKETKKQTHHESRRDQSRGRGEVPRLNIDISSQHLPTRSASHHERAPSPYAYTPKPSTSKEACFPAERLLSPDMTSPTVNRIRPRSDYFQSAVEPGKNHEQKVFQPEPSSSRRHVPATGYPGEHLIGNGKGNGTPVGSAPYPMSSDESDLSSDEVPKYLGGRKSGPSSPNSPRKFMMPRVEDFSQRKEWERHLQQQSIVPTEQTIPALNGRIPPRYSTVPAGVELQQVNTLLSSPRFDRQASPRTSPVASPHPTPPATPPGEKDFSRTGHAASLKNTPPDSRPASPAQLSYSPQAPRSIPNILARSQSGRSTTKPQSQMTSPLSSPGMDNARYVAVPGVEGASYIPASSIDGASYITAPRIDIREPSPARHIKSTSYDSEQVKKSGSRQVSLTPSTLPTLQKLPTGGRRRTLSNVETRPNLRSDAPSFQQAVEPLQPSRTRSKPTTRNRAISFESQQVALPPCPRPNPVAGHNDWYALVGCPSFTVCPSCRNAVFISGYDQYFTPASPKLTVAKIKCGFGTQWLRMAWLLAIQKKRLDPDLIYALAEIAEHEQPCPGKELVVGEWFRVVDGESRKQVSNFNVCPSCVENLETIFPVLRGVFQKSRSTRPDLKRSCDLRSDSKRFPGYIDLLESIANQANNFRIPPNMLQFIELAKEMVEIRECARDDMLLDQRWHVMIQIPELTVCEDCYLEIIRPAIKRGYFLASNFNRRAKFIAAPHIGVSCQLYSPRMRSAFEEACERNDVQWLRTLAVQRRRIEADLQTRKRDLDWLVLDEGERKEKVEELVEEWKKWE